MVEFRPNWYDNTILAPCVPSPNDRVLPSTFFFCFSIKQLHSFSLTKGSFRKTRPHKNWFASVENGRTTRNGDRSGCVENAWMLRRQLDEALQQRWSMKTFRERGKELRERKSRRLDVNTRKEGGKKNDNKNSFSLLKANLMRYKWGAFLTARRISRWWWWCYM